MKMKEKNKRHWIFTTYLIIMSIVIGSLLIFYIGSPEIVKLAHPNMSDILIRIYAITCIFQLICLFLMWKLKKIGFYLLIFVVLSFKIFNAWLCQSWSSLIIAPIGILILYGILQIGGKNKSWNNLT